MIYGPFAAFSTMIDDAVVRAPYVEAAMNVVGSGLVFKLLDPDSNVTHDDVMNAIARQCGMVVKHDAFEGWTYELTET